MHEGVKMLCWVCVSVLGVRVGDLGKLLPFARLIALLLVRYCHLHTAPPLYRTTNQDALGPRSQLCPQPRSESIALPPSLALFLMLFRHGNITVALFRENTALRVPLSLT
jgi:hypothetical protein